MVRHRPGKPAARRLVAAACMLAVVCATQPGRAQDAGVPEALHRPAAMFDRASTSMLLGIARAGRRLVAAGTRGTIVVSDDDGRRWRQVASPTSTTLLRIRFADDRIGWIVGHMGVVLNTQDGGMTWRLQLDGIEAAHLIAKEAAVSDSQTPSDPASFDPYTAKAAAQFLSEGADKPFLTLLAQDARHVLVAGAYGLAFSTADGGATWKPDMRRLADPKGLHVYDLLQVGKAALFAAGEEGLVLRADGAGAFQPLVLPYNGTIFGLATCDAGTVLAYGLRGRLFRSADLGTQWKPVDTGVGLSFTSSRTLADGRVALAGLSGQVLVSGDCWKTFTVLANGPGPITDVAQAADGGLVVVGPFGVQRLAQGPGRS